MNRALAFWPCCMLLISGLSSLGNTAHANDLKKLFGLANENESSQALFLEGVSLAQQNKSDEALKIFVELSKKHPQWPEPYNNMAVIYVQQGQYDKARLALEAALKTHPSYATAHQNLGGIYAKMASDAYDKALQVDHSKAPPQPKLALIKEVTASDAVRTAAKPAPSSKLAILPPPKVVEPVAAKPIAVKPAAIKPVAIKSDTPPPDPTQAVLRTVEAWAKAWSAKNVSAYLAYYANDFKTPNGETRAEWAKGRRERINRPSSIRVKIEAPKVRVQGNRASVTFRQNYRAGEITKRTRKVLYLRQSGNSWVIEREETGK
jgi:tetratricopeptide (TPR) repeat protein